MREILFKAKRIDNGEWVYGNYAFCDCYTKHQHYIFQNKPLEYAIDETTLCQYTGLCDKNGNKIWENDIVLKEFYTDYNAFSNSEEYVGKVEYEPCEWSVVVNKDGHRCLYPMSLAIEFGEAEHYIVIGNIFDNPEFLQ